jgi:hypothetical protein
MSEKNPPEKKSPSAEASGAHELVAGEMLVVVEHMKKSNEYIKATNKELIRLNRNVARQNTLLLLGAFTGVLLLMGYVYSLLEQRELRTLLETNAKANLANVLKLGDIADQLTDTQLVAEETKKAVEEQPTITVKPADTADPTSKPMLVVQPKPPRSARVKGVPPDAGTAGLKDPPEPKSVEIPIELPKKLP